MRQTIESCDSLKLEYPCGIFVSQNRIILCDYDGDRIHVFDENGTFIEAFGSTGRELGQFDGPEGVCVVGKNIWVTDFNNGRIQIFDSTSFRAIRSIPLDGFYPKGICFTLQGMIAVTTIQDAILILDQSGSIIRRFGSHGHLNGQFNNPCQVCSNSRGEILFADSCNNRVQVFSEDGLFLRTFGSNGNAPNQFNHPTGICVDQGDNIFVADYHNNRISIFDHTEIPIQQILVSKCFGLCLMKRQIIVTSRDHSVIVFSN